MTAPELILLAQKIGLDSEDYFALRVKFGIACIERVEHLLTAAASALALASSQPGSNSIDGAGSAAVTTSYGVAAALAGNALRAAGYAAYASVYSYASHAVTDVSAYEAEHKWQVTKLTALAIQGSQVLAKNLECSFSSIKIIRRFFTYGFSNSL